MSEDQIKQLRDECRMWKTIAGDYAMGLEEIRDASWSEVEGSDPPVKRIRRTADFWLKEGEKVWDNYNA